MAAKQILNGETGSSARTKINSVLSRGIAFADWDASVNAMPTNADNIGSGEGGDILKGDKVIFTSGGTIGGDDWPEGTIGIAKQNSPTLPTHWRLF